MISIASMHRMGKHVNVTDDEAASTGFGLRLRHDALQLLRDLAIVNERSVR